MKTLPLLECKNMNDWANNRTRKPAYESEDCRKFNLMATCNSCDRVIWEDENYMDQYVDNGGYCPECAAELIEI